MTQHIHRAFHQKDFINQHQIFNFTFISDRNYSLQRLNEKIVDSFLFSFEII